MSFVHLHLHTEYSLVDSVVRIQSEGGGAPGLMDAVAAAGMPAVALTDQSNLFAMVKFYRAAQAAGVKPIIGVDLRVREPGERAEPSTLVLLCQNEIGYRNLTRLVSRSYLEGQQQAASRPIDRSWLDADNLVGLIALSGAARGRRRSRDRSTVATDDARSALDSWLALFGDRYYLELQRTRSRRRGALHPRRAGAGRRMRRAGRGDQRRALHPRATTSNRTKRASAFRKARCSDDPKRRRRYSNAAVSEVAAADGASCSRTCPRRSRTRSRSRAAAASS